MNINKTGVFTDFIRNHTYIHQERMYCTYSLQLACQRTEISSGLAVLVQNGLQVVYWPEFKPSGSFVLWTKYLIIKLLCYFFLLKLIRRKKKTPTTQKQPPCVQPLPRTRAHSSPQYSGISVALTNIPWSQWFCWDSQLHIISYSFLHQA